MYESNKNNLDDVALNYFGNRITYNTMFSEIDKVAKAFVHIGIKKGDIVTLMLLNQPEMVYCAYALSKIGAVINFISVLASENEILNYITEANSKVLVALDVFNEKLQSSIFNTSCKSIINVSICESMPFYMRILYKVKHMISLQKSFFTWKDFLKNAQYEPEITSNTFSPQTFSYLAHTGGTTGTPKGIMLSDDAINGVVDEYRNNLNYKRRDRILQNR